MTEQQQQEKKRELDATITELSTQSIVKAEYEIGERNAVIECSNSTMPGDMWCILNGQIIARGAFSVCLQALAEWCILNGYGA